MSKQARAREVVEDLDGQIARILGATTPDAARRGWEDSLVLLERLWSRIEGAYSRSPKWHGFASPHIRARRDDPLLAYMKMARDSIEHGIEPVADVEPGYLTLNPRRKGEPMRVDNLEISEGFVRIGGGDNLEIFLSPPKLKLIAVSNRGVTRNPPTSHQGRMLDASDPLLALRMTRNYYVAILERAETFFS